jgi:hypothetical protein
MVSCALCVWVYVIHIHKNTFYGTCVLCVCETHIHKKIYFMVLCVLCVCNTHINKNIFYGTMCVVCMGV